MKLNFPAAGSNELANSVNEKGEIAGFLAGIVAWFQLHHLLFDIVFQRGCWRV